MGLPDADLGIAATFDSTVFRNAIHFAMQMGTNPDPDMRPVFLLRAGTAPTYKKGGVDIPAPRLDRDGMPYDPDIEVIYGVDTEIPAGPGDGEVDCAIEVEKADAEELPVGNFRPVKLTVTLLDVDYQKVKDCRELRYCGDTYMYGYLPEAPGLFDVGVYMIVFYARDES